MSICAFVPRVFTLGPHATLQIVLSAVVTSELIAELRTAVFTQDLPSRAVTSTSSGATRAHRVPRERFRCVLGMLSSSEVKVLRPTRWR